MAHVVAIDQVQLTVLARAYEQVRMSRTPGRVRQQRDTRGGQIKIREVECVLVEGREIVQDRKAPGGRKLEECIAPAAAGAEVTVTGGR